MDKVDVLAVLDAAIYAAGEARGRNDPAFDSDDIEEMRYARAAFAELIEASRTYYTRYCQDEADDTFDCSDFGLDTGCSQQQSEDARALRDALARVSPAEAR